MHVLVVPSWYPTTEAPLDGVYFAEQAQCLSQHGMRVGVVYPEQQSLRHASWGVLREKHFQTEWTDDYGLSTLRRYGWNVWWRFPPGLRCRVRSAVRLARRYVDRHGVPDLIHAQSGLWAAAAAARIGDALSIPYALTEHFSDLRKEKTFCWRWALIKEGFQSASAIAAVSTSLKRTITDLDLAPPSKVDVHPNLVSPSLFFRPPSNRSKSSPFHFVTVTHLRSPKNVDGLLNAFAQLTETDSAVRMSIVGDGPDRDELERQARRLNIKDHVRFRGRLDRDAVRTALWNAHAFVLPSHRETFGIVLIEAMATGLPVVATASGGPEDILTPETGILVPARDVDALADGLRRLKDRWPSFDTATIRQHTIEQYGPEPFVRRTRLLYRRALG